jgi:hypothetical protein
MDLPELDLDDWLQGCISGFTASDLSDEDGYITSFPARHTSTSLAQAKIFFNTYGFCVLSNVFDETECEETRQAMWDVVESTCPGLQRDDSRSWGQYQSTGKYGLSSRGPCFNPTLVNNRQNEFLANALSVLLDTTAEDVMVSHDRFTIYRATGLDARAGEYGPGVESGSTFATGRRNIHLDLNPWWWHTHARDVLIGADSLTYRSPEDLVRENNLVAGNMGMHVQCVLNFADNREEDGGTLVVPGFHRMSKQWYVCTSVTCTGVDFCL